MNHTADDGRARVRAVLKSQYHAALAMLRQAIERCPDEAWTDKSGHPTAFWHIAYHALYFTHLYLQSNEHAFRPWAHHREDYQYLGELSRPRVQPLVHEPYTKEQILSYLGLCEAMVDSAVDGFDLDAPTSGFHWYRLSKLEHQFINIRHIQHHAAQLADRLRVAAGVGVGWVSAKG